MCDVCFRGNLSAMEAGGATVLWNRSVERHSIGYKWIVPDRDSKAFKTVEDTYPDCQVVKLDSARSCPQTNGQAHCKI